MTFDKEKQMFQDWLAHPAWDILRDELIQEIEVMTQKLIDTDDVNLRAEIKTRQAFLNKLMKYNG